MADFPFNIPQSLATYAEQFEDDPLKSTNRLKKHLESRGPDAVGHFLLAWFYHLKGHSDLAVEQALKAKAYAPGSPFLEKLHYYMSHPDTFDAWTPEHISAYSSQKYRPQKGPEPILDLDNLIARLSEVDSEPISISERETKLRSHPVRSKDEDEVDDIASETLAKIHETQGKTEAAIRTYERLKRLNSDKKTYYDEQIERLKKQLNASDEEE